MALQWTVFPTDISNFHRQPTLLTGERDVVLIDGPFKRSDGERLLAAIQASGKRLTAIIVTCIDPDFYFGLGPIRAAYPDVPVWAPPVITAGIKATMAHKLNFWTPELKDEAPASLSEVVVPQPYDANKFELEGHEIQVVTSKQKGYVYLWLPTQRLIVGGVQISSFNHVWMADEPSLEQRKNWIASLEDMLALQAVEAIPGHMPPGAPMGVAAIRFTINYLRDFETELAKANSSTELIAAMKVRYPNLAMEFILDLGARVRMGEQQWP